jgi:hypothetical protein
VKCADVEAVSERGAGALAQLADLEPADHVGSRLSGHHDAALDRLGGRRLRLGRHP